MDRPTRQSQNFNARLVGSVILWSIGAWYAITRHANFMFGGRRGRRGIPVDAHGLDAFAIGCLFISLGIINLALGIRGPRRIPVFWAGAGLFLACVSYGIVLAVIAVVRDFPR